MKAFEMRNMLVTHRSTLFQHFESMRIEVLFGANVSGPNSREGRMTATASRQLLSAVRPEPGGERVRMRWKVRLALMARCLKCPKVDRF